MLLKPQVLMCPPDYYGIEYEINPWMDIRAGADGPEASRQWRALYETLGDLGTDVHLIEPAPGLPDLVFTANAGLVHGDLFLISRFRYGVRQAETPQFGRWFAAHGFRVEHLPEDVHFEGAGDALFCGETLFGGHGFRSDAEGLYWVGAHLGVECQPLRLVDPRFYHLDTCFCPLAEGEAIYYPGAFDGRSRSAMRDRIGRLIAVTAEEAACFGCNAVVVGRTVVLNEGAPRLARAMEEAGYAVRLLRMDEFIKSGGGPKCLTLRLDGEEAASWRRAKSAVA